MLLLDSHTLKIFLGGSIGYTTKDRQVIVRMDDKDLLTISRTSDGIALDAFIFDDKGNVLVELAHNAFMINHPHIFRYEADWHNLIVYDHGRNKVLDIKFINPSFVVFSGMFARPNKPPLVISGESIKYGDIILPNTPIVKGDCEGAIIDI